MATVNLGARFVLELAGVAAAGYAGVHASRDPLIGAVLAIVAVSALILVWSVVVAPRAKNRLRQPERDLVGSGALLAAAGALAGVGQPGAALLLGVAVVANQALLSLLEIGARDGRVGTATGGDGHSAQHIIRAR